MTMVKTSIDVLTVQVLYCKTFPYFHRYFGPVRPLFPERVCLRATIRHWRPTLFVVLAALMAAIIWGHTGAGKGWWDLGRIALVFVLVVVMLRHRADIGVTLLAAAVALGFLFALPLAKIVRTLTLGIIPGPEITEVNLSAFLRDAIILALVVALINVLGHIMTASGAIRRLITALERLSRDVRYVTAIVPSTLGLLPMPGGAMMTAPFVEELGARIGEDAAGKTAINFWFRHVWEYWWPMFPAVVLMTQTRFLPAAFSLTDLIRPGIFLSLVSMAAGWIFLLRRGRGRGDLAGGPPRWSDLGAVAATLWPVGVVVLCVAILPKHMPKGCGDLVFPAILVVVNAALVRLWRLSHAQVWETLKRSFSLNMTAMLFTVYILRAMFEASQAASGLPSTLREYHIPVPLICFLVPWIVGMLTGYTIAGVSTTFPLLAPLFTGSAPILIAYLGAFIGVLMSPVHLCLVLTMQYFRADYASAYRRLALPYAVILMAVTAVGLLLWR